MSKKKVIAGKINVFTRKDVEGIIDGFVFDKDKMIDTYRKLREYMYSRGFVFFREGVVFWEEVHKGKRFKIRYNCMEAQGYIRDGEYILKTFGVQYFHIK